MAQTDFRHAVSGDGRVRYVMVLKTRCTEVLRVTSVGHSVSHSVSQPVSQSVSRPVGQSAILWISLLESSRCFIYFDHSPMLFVAANRSEMDRWFYGYFILDGLRSTRTSRLLMLVMASISY